jgi:penicillin-binding protein 1B
MKVRVPQGATLARFVVAPAGRLLVAGLVLAVIAGLGVFTYYFAKYSRLIDQKLTAGPFANTAKIFAAPRVIAVGDAMSPADVAAALRRGGYSESRRNPAGSYRLRPDAIGIFPGPESYFDRKPRS